jgi:tetratricopeptide (TPR) repeat protein
MPRDASAARAAPGAARPVVLVRAAAGPNPRGKKMKKMKSKKVNKKRQEFIEQDGEKDQLAAAMREAAYRASRRSVDEDDAPAAAAASAGDSFEAKLAAVREQGKEVREARSAAAAPTMMDEIIAGGRGGRKVAASIYDAKPASSGITLGEVGGKTDEDAGLNALIRVGSGILALGLLLVFIPSDLTATAPIAPRQELTPEVLEQVRNQAATYERALADAGDDVAALKGAAESYVVLEDYQAAAPLLQRLLDLEPSVENVGNLADVWAAAGKPFKAAEAYKTAIEAEWSGTTSKPSALLKGFVDALDRDGRHGLALSYVESFAEKGFADDVDAKLLTARVYSGWKGHGKEAERAYQEAVDAAPEDFRGYLAKGVFFREIGKPAEAENLFRSAKSLAPREMADVVAAVIAQSKAQN